MQKVNKQKLFWELEKAQKWRKTANLSHLMKKRHYCRNLQEIGIKRVKLGF
jgi:hypothetical protein